MKTKLKGKHVIGYENGDHKRIDNGVVVYVDDRIEYVGKDYPHEVDRELDFSTMLICPGFVNLHSHFQVHANAIMMADVGNKDVYGSGILSTVPRESQIKGRSTMSTLVGVDAENKSQKGQIGAELSVAQFLRAGTTTAMDVGTFTADPAEMVEVIGNLGLRAYLGWDYSSAGFFYDDDLVLRYKWDEERGEKGLEEALGFIERYDGAFDGRIKGFLCPSSDTTVSAQLYRKTAEIARKENLIVQTHTCQTLFEFQEILRRHHKTPIQLLKDLGMLSSNTILGHCVFVSGHSMTAYPNGFDLDLIRDSGASVAHSPLVYLRRGFALESFHKYLQNGINIGIGTDTYLKDIITEMRQASFMGKMVERDFSAASSEDVFNAATVGSAKALGRDDIGCLAPGNKADITIVDLNKLHIGPYRDPIKALVNSANGNDVHTVIVDGEIRVSEGRVQGINEVQLLNRAQRFAEATWSTVQNRDGQGRTADEISPLCFVSGD